MIGNSGQPAPCAGQNLYRAAWYASMSHRIAVASCREESLGAIRGTGERDAIASNDAQVIHSRPEGRSPGAARSFLLCRSSEAAFDRGEALSAVEGACGACAASRSGRAGSSGLAPLCSKRSPDSWPSSVAAGTTVALALITLWYACITHRLLQAQQLAARTSGWESASRDLSVYLNKERALFWSAEAYFPESNPGGGCGGHYGSRGD